MRTLTYLVATTLDGFVAGPPASVEAAGEDGLEDFWPVGEDYVAKIVGDFPETLPAAARDALGVTAPGTRFDTVLEGRRSYETGLAVGVADAYPHLRHLVFSRTLRADPEVDVEVVATDPVARVRELKAEPGGGIWLVGGGTLAGSLYDEIDEVVLKLNPVTIGAGVPLFGTAGVRFRPQNWTRTGVDALPGGVTFLSYRR